MDFYRHGILKAIRDDNGLKNGEDFSLLQDFLLVLKTVVIALEEMEPVDESDPILKHFTAILQRFMVNYYKAFNFTFDS